MQELQDKTLLEIAKAFKGSFIYAPGGTVNIGCTIFDGPAPKKKATQAPSEAPSTPRRRHHKKGEEVTVPPKGQSTPPPSCESDEDDNGVEATSASEENNNSAGNEASENSDASNTNASAPPFSAWGARRPRSTRRVPPAGSA
jgi:hypothetical protein